MRFISPALWATIRRQWCLGSYTLMDISRKYSVSDATIRKRACLEKWPERGSAHADTEMMVRVQTDDAIRALDAFITEMSVAPAPANKADARELRAIIRALHQSIRALREIQRASPNAASADAAAPDFAEADKAFVLAKLRRMRRPRPRPESPPCKPTVSSTASPADPSATPAASSTG